MPWFLRLDKTSRKSFDLASCQEVLALLDPGSSLDDGRPHSVRAFYRTSSGEWTEAVAQWIYARGRLMTTTHVECEEYVEVTPTEVAEALKRGCQKRPPELVADLIRRPRWDRLKRELTFEGVTLRSYVKDNATNQFKLLDAFEECGWKRMVESPFKGDDRQLRETVDSLREGLPADCPVMFQVEQRRPVWDLIS
jgi:hypothetical protein